MAQLVGESSCEPKGHRFNSWSGHIPRLWVHSLVGVYKKATNQCLSVCLSPSLSLSPSPTPYPSPIKAMKKMSSGEVKKTDELLSLHLRQRRKYTLSGLGFNFFFPAYSLKSLSFTISWMLAEAWDSWFGDSGLHHSKSQDYQVYLCSPELQVTWGNGEGSNRYLRTQ